MMKRLLYVVVLSLALMHVSSATGIDLPDYYPEAYEHVGTLIGINTHDQYIVVNDFALPLASDPQVYTMDTRFETLNHLRPGMLIGIGIRQSRNEPVSEIWVLPDGY